MWFLSEDGFLTIFKKSQGMVVLPVERPGVDDDDTTNTIKVVGTKKYNNILYVDSKISIFEFDFCGKNRIDNNHVTYYRVYDDISTPSANLLTNHVGDDSLEQIFAKK